MANRKILYTDTGRLKRPKKRKYKPRKKAPPRVDVLVEKHTRKLRDILVPEETIEKEVDNFFTFVLAKAKDISSEAFFIYTVLRSDALLAQSTTSLQYKLAAKVVSDISNKELAERLKLPLLTINRFVQELQRKKWLHVIYQREKPLFQLGVYEENQIYWFESSSITKSKGSSTVQSLKRLIQERNSKKHESIQKLLQNSQRKTSQQILKDSQNEHTQASPKELVLLFRKRYNEYFKELPENRENKEPKNFFSKATVYINRLVGFCGSQDRAEALINFVFDNSHDVTYTLKLKHEINLSLFGTKSYVEKLLTLMDNRVLSVATRGVVQNDSPTSTDTGSVPGIVDLL